MNPILMARFTDYIEISFSSTSCVTLDGLIHGLNAKINNITIGNDMRWEMFQGLELDEDDLKRTIYLDGFQVRSTNGQGVPLPADYMTKRCITRLNVDAEPPILYSDQSG